MSEYLRFELVWQNYLTLHLIIKCYLSILIVMIICCLFQVMDVEWRQLTCDFILRRNMKEINQLLLRPLDNPNRQLYSGY